ncbi:MAG: prepilin-type N-terminal cleavage/methylation domain-containing protein [Phycisphaerales bacterium]|nr:MAG: prepilin-type N-terminal cleavage/methylation domain-containing protein [Phycisphaerales bacterium]
MHRQRGFTLIELLVVIAIIALLLAILMPALSRVKRQARSVTCQALLKQWGTIWSMYCDDNNGFFSNGFIRNAGWHRGEWVICLRHLYRTKTNILQCPSATKRLPTGQQWGSTYNTYWMPTGGNDTGGMGGEEPSYGGNNWIYNPSKGRTHIQNRPAAWNWRTKDVSGSNEIPVFADTMWRGGGPCYRITDTGPFNPGFNRIVPPEYDGQWRNYVYEMMHFAINRHETGTNMLFMDFTVRKVGLKELWKLKWHRNYPINGPLTRAGGAQPSDWPPWMRSFKDY